MARSPFIAARNSRHRTAALALYRALIRTASRVPLPQDAQQSGPVGPIVQIVRKRFAKNRPYTSPRLIYAAMTAGYKFLTLLTKAQTPDSPEHTQIINHINDLHATSDASRAASRPRRKPANLPPSPLLINITKPGEPPNYISEILPRPKSSLQGDRKVPVLCATADGQPFLRIKSHQPRALSKMVGLKGRAFSQRIIQILQIDDELAPRAALEDEWDRLMDDLMKKENKHGSEKHPVESDNHTKMTFSWSIQLSRLWWEWKVEKTWEDWVARGRALHHLVEEERALAEQEKGGDSVKEPTRDASPEEKSQKKAYNGPRPNVGLFGTPPLPLIEALNGKLPDVSKVGQEDQSDPFTSPAWQILVESQQWRMLKWAQKNAAGLDSSEPFDNPWARRDKEEEK